MPPGTLRLTALLGVGVFALAPTPAPSHHATASIILSTGIASKERAGPPPAPLVTPTGHSAKPPSAPQRSATTPQAGAPRTSVAAPVTGGAPPPQSLPQPVTDVTAFGARGDGHTNSAAAIALALTHAATRGGTLYFPTGHYVVSGVGARAALQVHSGFPLTIAGAGRDSVTLTDTNPRSALLSIQVDHTVVQDITLDTQSTNARQALGVVANYVVVQRCRILGGSQFFAVYLAGPSGASPSAPRYNVGNQLLDSIVNDQMQHNDGISWSFQQDSLIARIDHTGSRLALYVTTRVTVEDYTYHPSPLSSATAGFWISAPSTGDTVTRFVTYGQGGVLSDNGGQTNTNITINDEQFVGTGHALRVDAATGLVLNGCNLGTSNMLQFTGRLPTSVLVENCPALPAVRFAGGQPISATFDNDVFPAFTPPSGGSRQTFANPGGGPVQLVVSGGVWRNSTGGLIGRAAGMVLSISNLSGYSH